MGKRERDVCSVILGRVENNYKQCLGHLEREDLDLAESCRTMVWEDGNLMDVLECSPSMCLQAQVYLNKVNEGIARAEPAPIWRRGETFSHTILSAMYAAKTTLPEGSPRRVFVADFAASLNRKGLLRNEDVEHFNALGFEYMKEIRW